MSFTVVEYGIFFNTNIERVFMCDVTISYILSGLEKRSLGLYT